MSDQTYCQCILRKRGTNRFISALWIRPEHAKPGLVLAVQYTHAFTGVMGSRPCDEHGKPQGPWVEGRWSEDWVVAECWGLRDFSHPDPRKNRGTNNKTKVTGHV